MTTFALNPLAGQIPSRGVLPRFGGQQQTTSALTMKQLRRKLKNNEPVTVRQVVGQPFGVRRELLETPINQLSIETIEYQILERLLSFSNYTMLKSNAQLQTPDETGKKLFDFGQAISKLLMVLGNRYDEKRKAEKAALANKPKEPANGESSYLDGMRWLMLTGHAPRPTRPLTDQDRGYWH